MRTARKIAWVVLLGAFALGLGQWWRARSAGTRADAEIAAVRKRIDVIEAELRRTSQRPVMAGSNVPPAAINGGAAAASAVAEIPTSKPNATTGPDASQLLAAHRELVTKFEQAFRAQYAQDYAALYRRLGLSPAEAERFERRLFQDQLDKLDLSWTARTQGLKRDDPALQAVRRQQDAALETDLRAILGAEGYVALTHSRRAEGARSFINEVAAAMTLGERAMTRDQQDQLLQLVASHSQRYQQGGAAQRWDVDWDTVMAQAPRFLNPDQVVALHLHGDRNVRFVWLLPQFYAQRGGGAK
jgi:hypothetical protein